tara:strand:- start:12982 stop:13368 length:387 start_codon:yes stop_codon:yes gene_type:complete
MSSFSKYKVSLEYFTIPSPFIHPFFSLRVVTRSVSSLYSTYGKHGSPSTWKKYTKESRILEHKSHLLELKRKDSNRRIEIKNKTLLEFFILWIFSLFIGASMAFYGFKNWYYKVQLPLDKKNLNESNN